MQVRFDQVTPETAIDALPIHLQQSASHADVTLKLLLLMPAVVALAVPVVLLAAHAVAEPASLDALRKQPMSVAQIGLGIALWSLLFLRPLRPLIARAGTGRLVEITASRVQVTERRPFRTHVWSVDLASYRGIAHHVRSSLSGLRHELVLVHSDPARHVLLAAAPRISSDALSRTANLLGLPEVPASSLYARAKRRRPTLLVSQSLVSAGG